MRGAGGVLFGAALLLPALVAAQSVNGVLMQPDSVTPAAGVIVVASRPANDSLLARTMTNGNGRFVLVVPAGPVRVRALRIGYRPFALAAFTLGPGETRQMRAVLPSTPIVLAAITTRGTTACKQTGAAGEAVAAVFEEARKALIATMLTSRDARPYVRISTFSEQRSLGNRPQGRRAHVFSEGVSLRPFASLTPDSLAHVGYVERTSDGEIYWAPDADVLLSEPFAASHCLDLTEGTGDLAGWIGLTFRPAKRPAGRVDVRGTLWLDRSTSELRRMEYWYEGLTLELQEARPGGALEFTRLADGFWFISAWEIRMPRVVLQRPGARPTGLAVRGGEVWRVTRDEELVYTNGQAEPQSLADSLPESLPCAPGAKGAAAGMILGTVRDERRAPLVDAKVSVEWRENFKVINGQLTWQARQVTVVSARDGNFAACGVPRGELLTVAAELGRKRSSKVSVQLAAREESARVDLLIRGVRGEAPGKP